MSKKTDSFYYDNFSQCMEVSCEAAQMLSDTLTKFNKEELSQKLDEMHNIENKGDELKHDLMTEIIRAFITPLERDDMISLSHNIDEVTDNIEDILIRIYTNNVSVVREDIKDFSSTLIACTNATKELLVEFKNFKKSKKLKDLIIEINRLEEEGDKMYIEAMRRLHTTESDLSEIIAWREIYSYYEKCFDACEDVADVIESITINNL